MRGDECWAVRSAVLSGRTSVLSAWRRGDVSAGSSEYPGLQPINARINILTSGLSRVVG